MSQVALSSDCQDGPCERLGDWDCHMTTYDLDSCRTSFEGYCHHSVCALQNMNREAKTRPNSHQEEETQTETELQETLVTDEG